MFGKIFQRSRPSEPREIVDPVFGALVNDKHGTWNGQIEFKPLGKEIAISISCPVGETPSEGHRDFFKRLVAEWPKVHEELRHKLFLASLELRGGITPAQLFESLEYEFFGFGDFSSSPRLWEISATTPVFEGVIYNISMLDFAFKCYGMDD